MRFVMMFLVFILCGCATTSDLEGQVHNVQEHYQADAYGHYLTGVYYGNGGEFERAVQEKRKAFELSGGAAGLANELIDDYLRIQDYENALLMTRRSLEVNPEDPVMYLRLGVIQLRLGNYGEASEAFRRTVAMDPEGIVGYRALLGVEESKDPLAAIDISEQLIKLQPGSHQLYYHLGVNRYSVNNTAGAIEALEKALELNPAHGTSHYILGLIYLDENEPAKAAAHLRQYLANSPAENDSRYDAMEMLAAALGRLGHYGEAIQILDEIANAGAAEALQYLERTYLLLRAGKFAEAEAQVPPNGAPILGTVLRGLARKSLGQPFEPLFTTLDDVEGDIELAAREYLLRLIGLFGKDETSAYLLGELQAVKDGGIASLRLDSLIGRILMDQENYEAAQTVFEEALATHGNDDWVRLNLAIMYDDQDKWRQAEEHLKVILKNKPDDSDTMNFLGYMYAVHDVKLDEAEKLLERALEIDPGNPFYLDSLGWVYYRQNKPDLAIEYIHRALTNFNIDDAEVRDHLGDAFLLKGDVEQALKEWERAHRLNPEYEGVTEKIEQHGPK